MVCDELIHIYLLKQKRRDSQLKLERLKRLYFLHTRNRKKEKREVLLGKPDQLEQDVILESTTEGELR